MHHPDHVRIGAPRDIAAQARPALLQRNDDDFIESTLADLRTSEGRQRLHGLRAITTDAQGTLKLFQPIQRQFHLALIEAWCDVPGTPRLDPAKVEAAGLVLRRLGPGGQPQGWMRSHGRLRGWVPLTRVGGDGHDPVAAHRLARQTTGVADIDHLLAGHTLAQPDSWLDEDVIPLYVAPPDVCAQAGKTLYYGVVPTTSGELAEAEPVSGADDPSFGPRSALFRNHLVEALRGEAMNLPYPGEVVRAGWFDALEALGDEPPEGVPQAQADALRNKASAPSRLMRRLLMLLRQVTSEFDAFGSGPESTALRQRLHAIQLPLVLRPGETVRRHVRADDFLEKASTVLLEKGSVPGGVEMPESWPALSASDADALAAALHTGLQARFKAVKGKAGRYDEPGARYVLRAFVRLKSDCACAPRTVWSDYSEPFVIAPWYEGAGAPPVQIPLPDPSDRKLLKSLKPNVAFVVPPSLQNLLSGSAKDLMEGKGSTGTMGITWICSFSIPIITICAFLVLNIFLTLFNIVFGWMFFLKICLPFPKFGNKAPGS